MVATNLLRCDSTVQRLLEEIRLVNALTDSAYCCAHCRREITTQRTVLVLSHEV